MARQFGSFDEAISVCLEVKNRLAVSVASTEAKLTRLQWEAAGVELVLNELCKAKIDAILEFEKHQKPIPAEGELKKEEENG